MKVLDWGPVNWLDLRGAVAFHLTFHRSRAIHVNHLFFLHTYVWGMFMLSSACHPWFAVLWPVCWSSTEACLPGELGGMLRRFTWGWSARWPSARSGSRTRAVAPAAACLAVVAAPERIGARFSPPCCTWRHPASFGVLGLPSLGAGIALLSFGRQLAGHALHERLVSPARLFHGFIAASPLEMVAFFLRLGVPVAACVDGPALWAEVDERRRAALHGPALSTRSG